MAKTMYFGTKERMTWINCPAYNADISSVGWQSVSQYLNGGAVVRSSATKHREYQFSWPLASADETEAITNYAGGLYGDGLIYFLDPFAATRNVLPQFWAAPRLGAEDAPVFTGTTEVRPSLVDTASNPYGYPTKSAVYDFLNDTQFQSVYIPLPTGYTFHFGAHGSATGTAGVRLIEDGETDSIVYRYNKAVNDSFNTNTVGWIGTGSLTPTVSRQATGGRNNGAYIQVISTGTSTYVLSSVGSGIIPVVAGNQFAFSAYVRGTVGRSVQLRITWTGATATAASATTLLSSTAWTQRLSFTGTVPTGATFAQLDFVSATPVVGSKLEVDDVLFETGTTTIGTHFNGSNPTVTISEVRSTYLYQGVDSESPSQETVTTFAGNAVTLMGVSAPQRTNISITGVPGVTVSFLGTGTLTLSGMIAQVRLTGDPVPNGGFLSGQGHTGCRFAESPSVQGYSAPQALDYKSVSTTLIETGAWE